MTSSRISTGVGGESGRGVRRKTEAGSKTWIEDEAWMYCTYSG